jgi:hypothetical protein
MKQLSGQDTRYGYRRIHVFLSADRQRMSPGRAYRLLASGGSSGAAQARTQMGGGITPTATGADREGARLEL